MKDDATHDVAVTPLATTKSKPQLHVSGLNMLARCGIQFWRRYICGEIIAPAVAMIVGLATDRSVTTNLSAKIETGELLGVIACRDIARDSLNAEWDKGVELDEDERDRGEKAVRGDAVDKAVRLAQLHATDKAPELAPTHVQRAWTVELDGYPMDMVGTIDIQEGGLCVRDTKTSKKSPNANAADTSEQLTMYALAVKVIDGCPPRRVALDYLVDLKRGPVVKTLESLRDNDSFRVLLARIENATIALEAGVFVPARQDDWWCDEKYCGYHATCRYARGHKAVAIDGDNLYKGQTR